MKQEFNIPEGCNKVTIEQIGNKIVTEFETGFGRGDVVISKQNWICIYKHSGCYYLGLSQNTNKLDLIESTCPTVRLATQSEKQLLFNALAEAGKQWNAEALQIEDLKAEPKVGDYVKLIYDDEENCVYCRILSINGKQIESESSFATKENRLDCRSFCSYSTYRILTKSQFQSEVNALGFEYDFKNDTFKVLKWEPKTGEEIFVLFTTTYGNIKCKREIFNNLEYQIESFENGFIFKTKSECESAIEKIKNVLKSK